MPSTVPGIEQSHASQLYVLHNCPMLDTIPTNEEVPAAWTEVRENLASLPVHEGKYKVYEDIEDDFWTREEYTNDHPALTGLYGWLPETAGLDIDVAKATAESVWSSWNISNCWG